MTFSQRRQLRHLIDQAKRAAIAEAHGRTLNPTVPHLDECQHCGKVIAGTHHGVRRFCNQTCINAAREEVA